jgi:hypothetical protein
MKTRARLVTAALAASCAIGLLLAPLPRQFILATRIVTIATIERPDTVVFDYVTTPAHWPVWHPSSLSVSGATDHPLIEGEQVTEEFRVAGRRGRVVWAVAERDRPRLWVIEGAIDGRPAGTVSYTLTQTVHGSARHALRARIHLSRAVAMVRDSEQAIPACAHSIGVG